MYTTIACAVLAFVATAGAAHAQSAASQAVPPARDPRIAEIVAGISAERIENDIRTLVNFGTRNTYSDTLSATRGIGAARRWMKAEFDRISAACGGCLQVYYQSSIVQGRPLGATQPQDVHVVNVIAVLRGTAHPDNYIIMSGDIDSRVSNTADFTKDSPGANDNASGLAGVLEAARVMSRHRFAKSLVFAGLSGEEQGLWGGAKMAQVAVDENWTIDGVLNNDMIGNIEGVDGVIDNREFRIFSEPTPVTETEQQRRARRTSGGEVDGVSRQLARYVERVTRTYFSDLAPMMVYRLDRFGRGGHHRPFNDVGFAAVRIMEAHENYTRQHQDLREENGIRYGDVIEGVNFNYARKLTGVNAATMASLAWAPPAPDSARIRGAVQPDTRITWAPVQSPELAGYKVYWRLTTEPQWTNWVFVPAGTTDHSLRGLVIDNYNFGVAAVARNGNESVVSFGR